MMMVGGVGFGAVTVNALCAIAVSIAVK